LLFSRKLQFILQVMDVPFEFSTLGVTYDFQGALCFRPSSAGVTGVGHYTSICKRDGKLVLFNDKRRSRDTAKITDWLQKSRLLVYESLVSTAALE
jgi:hypothetical protein